MMEEFNNIAMKINLKENYDNKVYEKFMKILFKYNDQTELLSLHLKGIIKDPIAT
jgi:glucan phosphoethanolaminetransferase (alkaline phosphatase superfamily)